MTGIENFVMINIVARRCNKIVIFVINKKRQSVIYIMFDLYRGLRFEEDAEENLRTIKGGQK